MNKTINIIDEEIFNQIELFSADPTLKDRLSKLANRQGSFEFTHFGKIDVNIHKLLNLIKATDELCPPRSGHLGNWEDIMNGRSGAMDFNQAICSNGFGYPLIFGFNQTETKDLGLGDYVYLPGSLVHEGNRTLLPLYSWDGKEWARRDRDQPLFVPFILTKMNRKLVPLSSFHWSRMTSEYEIKFYLEASLIYENWSTVSAMLHEVMKAAGDQNNQSRAFSNIISHVSSSGGEIERATVTKKGNTYQIGDSTFGSLTDLIDASMIPFKALADPELFFDTPLAIPKKIPVLSTLIVGIFTAIFDKPQIPIPLNIHFHWGARAMAGYPPYHNGYYSEKSTIRSMRSLCYTLIKTFPEVDPLYLALLPASIFMLCPTKRHERDQVYLDELFSIIIKNTKRCIHTNDEQMMLQIEDITRIWLLKYRTKLSPYFVNRFERRRGVVNSSNDSTGSHTLIAQSFGQLSTRQASCIVGSLHKIVPQLSHVIRS